METLKSNFTLLKTNCTQTQTTGPNEISTL